MPIKNVEKIRLQRNLRDLASGDTVYTPPWAMLIDNRGNAYLDLTQPAHKRRIGDIIMLVKRLSFREGDYEVDAGSVYKTEETISYIWEKFRIPCSLAVNKRKNLDKLFLTPQILEALKSLTGQPLIMAKSGNYASRGKVLDLLRGRKDYVTSKYIEEKTGLNKASVQT